MYIVSDEKIEEQEAKGRERFLKIFTGLTWIPYQDKFDVCDLYANSSNTANAVVKNTNVDYYAEVKAREIQSTDFYSAFLECKKYEHLMALASSSNGRPLYFVSYTDNTDYLFDLKNINVEQYKTKRLMKEVSLEGQAIQILKDVYELPLDRKMKGVTRYRW